MPTTVDLGQATKHRYPGSYDNVDDAALGEMMKKRYPGSYDRFQSMPDWRNTAVDAMPGLAGIGGSIAGFGVGAAATPEAGGIGGPFVAPIGAGIAGGLAAKMQPSARKLLGLPPAPDSMQVDPMEAAKQQMEFSATGELLGPAAGLAARVPMAMALRSSPEVAATALKEGIVPTRVGLQKLMSKIGEAGDKARQIAATAGMGTPAAAGQAATRGLRYKTLDIVNAVKTKMMNDIEGGPITQDAVKQINTFARKMLEDNPTELNPAQLLRMRQKADVVAEGIHQAANAKQLIPDIVKVRQSFFKNVADLARDKLHTDIPELATQDAATQKLIQLKNAVEPITPQVGKATHGIALARAVGTRAAPVAIGGAAGAYIDPNHARGFVLGGLGGASLSNPLIMSQLARIINSKILRQILLRGAQVAGSYGSLPGDQVAQ